jgi:hypothetical protein
LARKLHLVKPVLGDTLRKTGTRPDGAVEKEILRYFLRNPSGADTLEGIAQWRLFDQGLYRSIEETDRAVNALVSHGFLIEDPSIMFTGPVFRLDLKKRDQAEQYLKRSKRTTARAGRSSESDID